MLVNCRVEFFCWVRRKNLAKSLSTLGMKSRMREHTLDESTFKHLWCANFLIKNEDLVCLGDSHLTRSWGKAIRWCIHSLRLTNETLAPPSTAMPVRVQVMKHVSKKTIKCAYPGMGNRHSTKLLVRHIWNQSCQGKLRRPMRRRAYIVHGERTSCYA